MTFHRTLLLASIFSSLFQIGAQANDIEPGKETYTAIKTTNPIVLDGDLSEWTGSDILADPRFSIPKGSGDDGTLVNFELNGGDWTGPDDHTSSVQVVYDDDNVYFGFIVTDEYHEHSANPAWRGDSVQLMIANGTRDTQVALYNYALRGVEGALTDIIVNHEDGPGGTEAIVTRDAVTKKTTYEIKLPKTALDLPTLEEGVKFGLGMAINDGDEFTPGQSGWGGLGAHAIVFGKSPEETAEITLGASGANTDAVFFSAISTSLTDFSFRANDMGTSIVDPLTATLLIDGQPAALVASPPNLGATDFTHTFTTPYPPGTEHTFTIELMDTLGTTVTESSTFTAFYFGTLTPEMQAENVSLDRPGFKWRVFQNEIFPNTSLANTELAILGQLVDDGGFPVTDNNASNIAPFGPAIGAGVVIESGLLEFEIPTVIDLNSGGENETGNFTPDQQMPGVPGINASSDGVSAEIITYVDLPAGFFTMGVNSDDAFRAEGGIIEVAETRVLLGEFDGPRDANNTTFFVNVIEAGIYPLRVIWNNGGGQGQVEIFTVKEDGTKVLLNDTANGGFQTYRSKIKPPLEITEITRDAAGNVTLEWNSNPGKIYALDFNSGLSGEWPEVDDYIPSQGTTTQTTVDAATLNSLSPSGKIFLRVREF